jgi:hypothetical protein
MSLKETLLKSKLPTKEVNIRGNKIKVRSLTGLERLEFGNLDDSETPEAIRERYWFIWSKAVDLGEAISKEEFNKIFDCEFPVVFELFLEVLKLGKMDADSVKDAEKN